MTACFHSPAIVGDEREVPFGETDQTLVAARVSGLQRLVPCCVGIGEAFGTAQLLDQRPGMELQCRLLGCGRSATGARRQVEGAIPTVGPDSDPCLLDEEFALDDRVSERCDAARPPEVGGRSPESARRTCTRRLAHHQSRGADR